MRFLPSLALLALLCACPSAPVAPPEPPPETQPSALPADHLPPSRLERPPTGVGLPAELKPPGR